MNTEVLVRIEKVYGVYKTYPANPAACIFAQIAGTICLTDRTISSIKELGFVIRDVTEVRAY